MKNRITIEAHQTRSLFNQFKDLKSKCQRLLKQTNTPVDSLNQRFRDLEQMFAIDLNLLPLQHITQRKNKVVQGKSQSNSAIDQIIDVESEIKLKRFRRWGAEEENGQGAAVPEQREENRNQEWKPVREIVRAARPQSQQAIPPRDTRPRKPTNFATHTKPLSLPEEQIQSIQNQMSFDHLELLNVWGRYKGCPSESCDDKLDRLSKLIGTLKTNVRNLTEKQKQQTAKTNLMIHPQYVRLLQQVEQLRMQNEELAVRNRQLEMENKTFKKGMENGGIGMGGEGIWKGLVGEERKEVLFENREFRIVKVRIMGRSRHSSSYSLEKPAKHILDLPNIIKYTHLLQQRIVDNLSRTTHLPTPQLPTRHLTSKTSITPYSPIKQVPQDKQVTRQTSTRSEINSNSVVNFKDINSKLNEIRSQRKKMFEDEEMWSQIERLQI